VVERVEPRVQVDQAVHDFQVVEVKETGLVDGNGAGKPEIGFFSLMAFLISP